MCNPHGAHLRSCLIRWSYNHSSGGQVVATRVILVVVIESGQGCGHGGSITVVSPHCHRCHGCAGAGAVLGWWWWSCRWRCRSWGHHR